MARAAKRWHAGEAVLAQIELAFARLPRLQSDEDAYRLYIADHLLSEELTPRELFRGLGFDPELCKYDPNQPRVPAGNGRASGRWGSDSNDAPDTSAGTDMKTRPVGYVPPDHCALLTQVGEGGACVYDCKTYMFAAAPTKHGACHPTMFYGNGKLLNDNFR